MSTPTTPVASPVRQEWLDQWHEEILEPALPIIDPHHHLWDRPGWRYLLDELLVDLNSGHCNVGRCTAPTGRRRSAPLAKLSSLTASRR